MNLQKIKEIINGDYPDEIKESAIISVLASDNESHITLLKIVLENSAQNQELINQANIQLCHAEAYIEDHRPSGKNVGLKNKDFVLKGIKQFYKKNSGRIQHLFKRD